MDRTHGSRGGHSSAPRSADSIVQSFIRYSVPSHRIEQTMEAMYRTFEIDGSFAFLRGLTMIPFGDSDTHTPAGGI
ncbi:hypothetical protein BGZ80_004093 [Entomortierella chlamydospora]|uniref:Uncharacterized protein n=1 Tax=Entomortierella chlamydospora TaxID=101097 RepID=A0A9P6MMH1_9FUNG|nr:hypothetical protein BGZ80_004093 [Entomortierella chlamydospora]